RYHSPQMTLPCFRNAENMGATALPSSVSRCSFLNQKADLSFSRLRWRHQFPEASNTNHPLFPELACLLHLLRQDLVDERLIRQSLFLSGFTQPTQDFRI